MLRRKKKFIRRINRLTVDVLKGSTFSPTTWNDIHPGDIIRLKNGDVAPADLIVLKASNSMQCTIDFYLIDGSSQLAPRYDPTLLDIKFDGSNPTMRINLTNIKREFVSGAANIKSFLQSHFVFSADLTYEDKTVQITNK
ncbi:hypothetical protein TVAG_156600 [Trichomonas vaginalis G3]|uniref:P-type ATPase A domain-containing protein n=1 Tax=Trichomonas vaginalis (strain ATCC PRA-98 / G3) TaxID=412133 RepID=A2FRT2_TRIV3|nr:phospholipid-translocating ATPase protein [Trichomonas vaginalis G3]EAX92381.1 hypothetical protein TVAG_156600 [Trichomonas vaginalis G3]KAI5544556.1 phospholipid-translocating ATPase protein [Trichomonas vaginalis G3]|eukprot:XP_001305311.1 hypothetical protein [Trichomonas vaginalis G3]